MQGTTPTCPLGSTSAAAQRALADLKQPPAYRVAFGGLDWADEKHSVA